MPIYDRARRKRVISSASTMHSARRMKHAQKVDLLFDACGTARDFCLAFGWISSSRDGAGCGDRYFVKGAFRDALHRSLFSNQVPASYAHPRADT